MKRLYAIDEGEREHEPDQERADGVRDALAQLVEVLEERHPAFAGFLIVIAERRKAPGLLRKVLLGRRLGSDWRKWN